MGRWFKEISVLGLPPPRLFHRMCAAEDREIAEARKQHRKALDEQRPKCGCKAYPWPHRPAGGLCRHPDPPTEVWKPKEKRRRYRNRYTGLRRQIARANGLHPIKDREAIERLIPKAIQHAKRVHAKHPKAPYRTTTLTETGVRMSIAAD